MENSLTNPAANSKRRVLAVLISVALFSITSVQSAPAQTLKVLHNFNRLGDGIGPRAGVIMDADGNLYGTTASGVYGYGTIFKIDTSGKESLLHIFVPENGEYPWAGLIVDANGTFYGTTFYGGREKATGTVFSADASGHFSVLHAFNGSSDGFSPYAGLLRDASGNLYGTTSGGGSYDSGIVFKLDPAGKETILHSFGPGNYDGGNPMGGLVTDKNGNLYGTTYSGGDGYQEGIVFKLDSNGKETILYAFTGESDGSQPQGNLIRDDSGNLYGTTTDGGLNPYGNGCGTVFQLEESGHITILYTFKGVVGGGPDGCHPVAGLVRDQDGNLYGTTRQGGISNCRGGCGTIFKLTSSGKETVLHRFAGGDDGWFPHGGLLRDSAGNLYGTTFGGGYYDKGMVFKFTP